MKIQLSPDLTQKLKRIDVRIRKSFYLRIELFQNNHMDSHLNNHALKGSYKGFRSIDITNDYRAIYEEVGQREAPIAYFFLLGTHKELYG